MDPLASAQPASTVRWTATRATRLPNMACTFTTQMDDDHAYLLDYVGEGRAAYRHRLRALGRLKRG